MKTFTLRSSYSIALFYAFLLCLSPLGHTANASEEVDWAPFKSAPVTLPDGTVHMLDEKTEFDIQKLSMALNARFNFITNHDIPTTLTPKDIYRAAEYLRYWTLYHQNAIRQVASAPDEDPGANFLATFFATKMTPPKGNPTRNPEFMMMPDLDDPQLIFAYLIDTLHHVTGGWVRTESFFTLVDIIGNMMTRTDYNLGEVRVLAYWLWDNNIALTPETPNSDDALFAADDAQAQTSLHTLQIESTVFDAAQAFYRGPTPWDMQQKVMHVLHRIAFAINTPYFEDASREEILTTPPLNALPGLRLPTIRDYMPFLVRILTHFGTSADSNEQSPEGAAPPANTDDPTHPE